MVRQHKAAILFLTTKNLWLLLIPLVRGLVAIKFDFYSWIQGAYLDLIVIAVIIASAILRWFCIGFSVNEEYFTYKAGVIAKFNTKIHYSSISAVTSERPFWLRPFKAVRVYIETDGTTMGPVTRTADISLITNEDHCSALFRKLYVKTDKTRVTHHIERVQLLFFSLVFSSTLSGVIFIVTLFIQGGKLVGQELENKFLTAVNNVTDVVERAIRFVPRTALLVALIIGAGWLISVIRNFLRHDKFKVSRKGNNITITNGFLTKRKYYMNSNKINYADLRQTLFMKLCAVMSVHINCSGYGKAKNEIPVFIPVLKEEKVQGIFKEMLPAFVLSENEITTRKGYVLRFLMPPTLLIFGIMIAAFILDLIYPEWYSIILFLTIMAEIPFALLLVAKCVSFLTNGISFKNDVVCLRYSKAWQFHTVVVPMSRVARVSVKQTLFQRANGSCDVIINSYSEHTGYHRVRGMNLDEAVRLIKNTGIASTANTEKI